MNPARALGPALVASAILPDKAWNYHYIYWVGPICGSIVSALLYRYVLFVKSSKNYILTAQH